jgi:hypothetical protein
VKLLPQPNAIPSSISEPHRRPQHSVDPRADGGDCPHSDEEAAFRRAQVQHLAESLDDKITAHFIAASNRDGFEFMARLMAE